MKRLRFISTGLIVCVAALGLTLAPGAASAKVVNGGNNGRVGPSETVNDDLYISGQNVDVEGTINGDVYAAGQDVTINATVNGDIIAAGQSVSISGKAHSVRVAGQTIRLSGLQTSGGVTTLGQNVTTESDSVIGGGLAVLGQSVTDLAKVSNGVTGAAQQITIDNEVGRGVDLGVNQLTLGSNARIAGDLTYQSNQNANIEQGAVVSGKQIHTQPPMNQNQRRNSWGGRVLFSIWAYVASLVIGLLALWLLRPQVRAVAQVIRRKPWQTFGWGVLAILVVLPGFIALCITVIGIPLAFMLTAWYALTLYVGKLFVSLAVAEASVNRWKQPEVGLWLRFSVVLFIFYILTLIPFFGPLLSLVVAVLGSGAWLVAAGRTLSTKAA